MDWKYGCCIFAQRGTCKQTCAHLHLYCRLCGYFVSWTCSRGDNDNRSSTVLFIRSCGSAQKHINRPNESVAWHACIIKYVSREHAWTLCLFPVARGVNVCQNMHMYSCLSAVVNVELYCPVVLLRHRGSGKQWRSICAWVLMIARMIRQHFHIWITDHAGEWTDKYSLSLGMHSFKPSSVHCLPLTVLVDT